MTGEEETISLSLSLSSRCVCMFVCPCMSLFASVSQHLSLFLFLRVPFSFSLHPALSGEYDACVSTRVIWLCNQSREREEPLRHQQWAVKERKTFEWRYDERDKKGEERRRQERVTAARVGRKRWMESEKENGSCVIGKVVCLALIGSRVFPLSPSPSLSLSLYMANKNASRKEVKTGEADETANYFFPANDWTMREEARDKSLSLSFSLLGSSCISCRDNPATDTSAFSFLIRPLCSFDASVF